MSKFYSIFIFFGRWLNKIMLHICCKFYVRTVFLLIISLCFFFAIIICGYIFILFGYHDICNRRLMCTTVFWLISKYIFLISWNKWNLSMCPFLDDQSSKQFFFVILLLLALFYFSLCNYTMIGTLFIISKH